MSPILISPHKALKSFLVKIAFHDYQKPSAKRKNMYLIAYHHQNHINIDHPSLPPGLFGAVPQSYLRCCLPGYSPHFATSKTDLTTLTLCIFLSPRGEGRKRKYECTSTFR